MRTQTVDLNLIPGSISPTIHLTQYDKDAGALIFNVYGESGFYIPPNSIATITGTKPDGYGFSYSASIRDNVVTADVTQQMTAVPGIVKCELRITSNNDNVGSQTFYLDVKEAALDENTVISDSDLAAIAMAEQYASSAAQSAGEAATLVSQINSLGRGQYSFAQNKSVNAIVDPGFYFISTNSPYSNTDMPEGTNGNLWVYSSDNGYVVQIFRRIGSAGTDDGCIYIRRINTTGTDARSWWKYVESTVTDNLSSVKLNKAGGTMTGDLIVDNLKSIYIKNQNVTVGTNPSSNNSGPGIFYRDSGSTTYGQIRTFYLTNGVRGLLFNGSGNYFRIGISGDGSTPYVYFNNPAVWRTALGFEGNVHYAGSDVWTVETGYSISRAYLYVHDKVVTLSTLIRGPVVASANTRIATLSSSGALTYKPKVTIYFSVGTNSAASIRGYINANGQLDVNSSVDVSNPYLAINASWILDD